MRLLVIRCPVGGVQEAVPAAPLLVSLDPLVSMNSAFLQLYFECRILNTHFSRCSFWDLLPAGVELIFSAGSRSLNAPGGSD